MTDNSDLAHKAWEAWLETAGWSITDIQGTVKAGFAAGVQAGVQLKTNQNLSRVISDVLKEHCGQEGGNPRIDWYRLRKELVSELKKIEEPNKAVSKTCPAKGDKMKFLAANGYEHQLKAAKAKMKEGEILTVNNIKIGGWESSIEFEELTGRWNSVMFEMVEKP